MYFRVAVAVKRKKLSHLVSRLKKGQINFYVDLDKQTQSDLQMELVGLEYRAMTEENRLAKEPKSESNEENVLLLDSSQNYSNRALLTASLP